MKLFILKSSTVCKKIANRASDVQAYVSALDDTNTIPNENYVLDKLCKVHKDNEAHQKLVQDFAEYFEEAIVFFYLYVFYLWE
jgi:hypothetical protein